MFVPSETVFAEIHAHHESCREEGASTSGLHRFTLYPLGYFEHDAGHLEGYPDAGTSGSHPGRGGGNG